ncbi:hypothetical protein AAC387_Pa10g1055 [Persea americana]
MDERASKSDVDYSSRNKIFVDAWEGQDTVVKGGVAVESDNDHRKVDGANRRIKWAFKKVNSDDHGAA